MTAALGALTASSSRAWQTMVAFAKNSLQPQWSKWRWELTTTSIVVRAEPDAIQLREEILAMREDRHDDARVAATGPARRR